MTPIAMTAAEFWHVSNSDMVGICRACGAWHYSVEPDATRYPCEDCGAREVYGLDELLQRGEIEITEGWD